MRGVIFDMDGVLVLSEPFIAEAAIRMFAEKGHRMSEDEFRPFIGMGEDRFIGGVAERRGIALDPTSWQGYFELSKALLAKQNYEASLRNANKAFDLAPKDYPPLHLVRAHIYLGLKNYDQAMAELEGYLEHAPKDPTSEQARKTLDQVRAFVATKK